MLTRMYTQTERGLSSTEMTRLTGLTYRQLDYWIRNGVIPAHWVDNPHGGSGHHRHWNPDAVRPLQVAGRITRALPRGTNLSSADMKRVLRNWTDGHLDFGDGIHLTWT